MADRGRCTVRMAAAALSAAVLLAGCGDDETDVASSSATTATTAAGGPSTSPLAEPAELAGDAASFADALARAGSLTYHARYEGQGRPGHGSSKNYVVEVWRRSASARRDTTVVEAAKRLDVREYSTPDGPVVCYGLSDDGSGDYRCQRPPPGKVVDAGAPAFGAVKPSDGPVTAVDESVDGMPVRCYRLDMDASAPAEVCFDGDGIPVVVDDGKLRLVRAEVATAVSDADLTPPPLS